MEEQCNHGNLKFGKPDPKIFGRAYKDLSGNQYSEWTALYRVANNQNGHSQYACRCSCGTQMIVNKQSLENGSSRSCGCLRDKLLSQRSKSKTPPPLVVDTSHLDQPEKTSLSDRYENLIGRYDNLLQKYEGLLKENEKLKNFLESKNTNSVEWGRNVDYNRHSSFRRDALLHPHNEMRNA